MNRKILSILIVSLFFVGSSSIVFGNDSKNIDLLNKNMIYNKSKLVNLISKSDGLEIPSKESGKTEYEVADINKDGYLDIISVGDHGSPLVNSNQHGIMVWLGDDGDFWDVHQNGDFGYGGCAIGDLNLDGFLDVAWGVHHDWSSNDFGDTIIDAALGDGTADNWEDWGDGLASAGEDWGMFATDLADFDLDGDLDIVSESFGCCNGIHVYENNFDGSWTHIWDYSGGNVYYTLETGDFNLDGFPDFVGTHQDVNVYLGDGSFGFTNADSGLPVGDIYVVDSGDMDNDGSDDLVIGLDDLGVRCYTYDINSENWNSESSGLPTSGDYHLCQFGDLNGDGDLDIVAYSDPIGEVYLGNGNGGWSIDDTFNMPAPGGYSAMRVDGDVDHDGREDIVIQADAGSWPNEQNTLKCFSPWQTPTQLSTSVQIPHGGEVFRTGSIRNIRWLSAVPSSHSGATVDIKISRNGETGPWNTIASNLPNNGNYQWIVSGTESYDCRIKVIVDTYQGSTEAISEDDFIIVGSGSVLIVDANGPYSALTGEEIQFTGSASGGTTPYSWSWDFGDGNFSVEQNPTHTYFSADTYDITLTVTDSGNLEATDTTFAYIQEPNNPPIIPEAPEGPSNLEVEEVGLFTVSTTDPENDQIQYQINWGDGTSSSWTDLADSGEIATLFNNWSSTGTYGIKTRAKDEHGLISDWSETYSVEVFVGNIPPDTPNIPNGPTELTIGMEGEFTVKAIDPDGDQIQYQFDWDADGMHEYSEWSNLVDSNTDFIKSHSWGDIGEYVIKVRARDEQGAPSSWSEGLAIVVSGENNPPLVPTIDGETEGRAGEEYEYSFSTTDPEGDDVYYWIVWGDSCPAVEWIGPFRSGEEIRINHTYEDREDYTISVKAKDINEAESDWGYLDVNIPKNRFVRFDFYQIFKQFFTKILIHMLYF